MRHHKGSRQSVQSRTNAHAHDVGRVPWRRSRNAADAGKVVKTIVPLCLPSCNETGKLYDFRQAKFLEFRSPA